MTNDPLPITDELAPTSRPDATPVAVTSPGNGTPEPSPLILTPVEIRVLGSLIEKEISTPEYYPLTLNALTLACNQKSNREPVMALTNSDVERSLDTLRYHHQLASRVQLAGSRSPKFKHTLAHRFKHSPEQAAVLCELMLRGPQTSGELRGRASRLIPFDAIETVDRVLRQLCEFPGQALAIQLARETGRREARFMHLLGGPPDVPVASAPPADGDASGRPAGPTRMDRLETELASLRQDIDRLRRRVDDLQP